MAMLIRNYGTKAGREGERRFDVLPRPGETAEDVEAERRRLEAAYGVPLVLAEVRQRAEYGPVYVLRSS